MTSAQMKAAVDTALDEVTGTATFWTATEVYSALSDGQNEIINKLLAVYRAKRDIVPETPLPLELASIAVKLISSVAASYISLPTGFLELVAAKWDYNNGGTKYPCKILTPQLAQFQENNTFLAGTATDPRVWVGVDNSGGSPSIIFRPTYSTTGVYDIDYLDKPTDMTAVINAELPANTHNAIVEFAISKMFDKDQRPDEAQKHYNLFLEQLKLMIGL